MRHQVHGKKLNRSSGHRKALYRNLVQSLVEHERITTTLAKAKAIRPVAEKMITRAKDQDLAARRALISFLPTKAAADKMYSEIAPRFAERPGGYTRIIKIGRRTGDGVEMAVLELVDLGTVKKAEKKEVKKASNAKVATTEKKISKATASKKDEVVAVEEAADTTTESDTPDEKKAA